MVQLTRLVPVVTSKPMSLWISGEPGEARGGSNRRGGFLLEGGFKETEVAKNLFFPITVKKNGRKKGLVCYYYNWG